MPIQTRTPTRTSDSQPQTSARLLQRSCACGAAAGLDGACQQCRRQHSFLQRRLRVNRPGDRAEQAAEQMAHRVGQRASAAALPARPQPGSPVALAQAQPQQGEPVNGVAAETVEAAVGSGRPLPPQTQAQLEPHFGFDFSRVRVHTGGTAASAARQLNAHAFTSGRDIVFAAGRYRPETSAGLALLSHELTHVVQQESASQGGLLQRDGPASGSAGARAAGDTEREASNAELFCDVRTLCTLHFAAPTVIPLQRVRSAVRRCRPTVPLTTNPCLLPDIALPTPDPQPAAPTPATPSTSSSPAAGGLSQLTNFRFNLGPAAFNLELPSSLNMRLPVPLRGSRSIVFSLSATTSGAFSFTATLDGLPHIRIAARAGLDVGSGEASAALTFTTTRTVCRVTNPEAARSQIQTTGQQLQTAINEWQSPPPVAPGSTAPTTLDRLSDVASAIGSIYAAVERAKGPCREVPAASLEFGARTPVDLGIGEPMPPERRPASYLGATLTVPF